MFSYSMDISKNFPWNSQLTQREICLEYFNKIPAKAEQKITMK